MPCRSNCRKAEGKNRFARQDARNAKKADKSATTDFADFLIMTDNTYSDTLSPERLFSSIGSKMHCSHPIHFRIGTATRITPDAVSIRGEKTDGYCPEPYAAVFPQGTAQPAIRFRHGKRSGRQVRC